METHVFQASVVTLGNLSPQSGLTQACLKSPHTIEDVSKAVLAYIKKWIPKQRVGVLAGNSVHADRSFLVEEMPGVIDWLHYRSVSLSFQSDIKTVELKYL